MTSQEAALRDNTNEADGRSHCDQFVRVNAVPSSLLEGKKGGPCEQLLAARLSLLRAEEFTRIGAAHGASVGIGDAAYHHF
mmetsp:Transcript_19956/g.30742  ORF Transcript_19956/g.30742 Transcript_19956/m.30742 type:complete len:81 (+) Transcript_19956:614-856(+)